MKTRIVVSLLALAAWAALPGCSSVSANTKDGKAYTCFPSEASQRGPFIPSAPAGTPLTVVESAQK